MNKIGKVEVREFKARNYLNDPEMISLYLAESLKSGDYDEILHSFREVIKSKGFTNISKQTGLSRESLYKSFKSGAKPRFETVLKILKAFDVKLQVVV